MEILDRMNKLQQMLLPLFIEGNASRNTNENIGAYAYFLKAFPFLQVKKLRRMLYKHIIEKRESLLSVKYVYKRKIICVKIYK